MAIKFLSTAIVLQTLHEKGLIKTEAGQNAFSILLFQDIAVIPLLALLPLLSTLPGKASEHTSHQSTGWLNGFSALQQTAFVLLILLLIILVGIYILRPLLRLIAKSGLREIFTATSLLLVVGIALLMTRIGLSPALGTFLAGVVLAGS